MFPFICSSQIFVGFRMHAHAQMRMHACVRMQETAVLAALDKARKEREAEAEKIRDRTAKAQQQADQTAAEQQEVSYV